MIEMDNENVSFSQEPNSLRNPYISKDHSNFNKAIPQHPTIAEELEAAFETQMEEDSFLSDRRLKDLQLPLRGYQKTSSPKNIKTSEAKEIRGTFTEHLIPKSKSDTFNSGGLVETGGSNSFNNYSVPRTSSLRQRTSNIIPKSPILEGSESIDSQETIEADILNVGFNDQTFQKEGEATNSYKPRDRRDLYKRMASDTDLWMSMKSRHTKFQSNLQATKETSYDSSVTPSKSKNKYILIRVQCYEKG